jgi:ribosomal protein L7Ae-like RNA K-turn-binding protein
MSVHPSRRCLGLAFKQGRMRSAGADSVEVIAATASGQYRRRAAGLLNGAWRSRQLAIGTEAVRESFTQRTIRLLVIAADAANNRQDFEQAAARLERRCLVWATKAELGAMLGRETVGVLGVLDESIGEELRSAAQHIGALAEDA